MRKVGLIFVLLLVWGGGHAQGVKLVVSIPPLAAMVMPLLGEQDALEVLLTPGASPHGFQLKPSHVAALREADLVVTIGTGADAWMMQALRHYEGAHLAMAKLAGLQLLPKRDGGVWSHAHRASALATTSPVLSDKRMDGHIWLGLDNARALIRAVSAQLQTLRPLRAGEFAAREAAILAALAARETHWRAQLLPYQAARFIVMHDAYQYFERYHGLQAAGTIHVNPELPPSAKRIEALRDEIAQRHVQCVFKEPQFPQARLQALVRGLEINIGELDPLGFDGQIQPYQVFYDKLVQDFVACFE
ncbi:MAG: zinc ABC transporter substrate-binding protein [Thiomicrospira sp.]